MSTAHGPVRVALLGFSGFERNALAACFRLSAERVPRYEQVTDLDIADLLVADADHAPTVHLVQVTERLADTVFIGTQPPEDARAWMARPIDPLHVMRELDAMVAQRAARRAVPVPMIAPPPDATAPPEPLVLTLALASVGAAVPVRPPVSPPAPVRTSAPAASSTALAPAPTAPAAAPPPHTEAPRAASRSRRNQPDSRLLRHALVVDDSPVATLFLHKCLQSYGLDIATAASSGRATLLLSQKRFDLIFLDVELGDDSPMDGLGLCQQIRRHAVPPGEHPPVVVMVSAHHRELDRVRGTLAGCDAYLAKPLQQADLDKLMLRHGVTPKAAASTPAVPAPKR